MKFKKIIVKKPSKKMVKGISTSDLGKPNYDIALKQHAEYVKTLKECGVKVEVLEADEKFPDSCFVEDPAVVTKECAIITNPGADSRKGEVDDIRKTLKKYYSENLYEIKKPGTLEGGDVMQVEDYFYVGVSERTNKDGAEQLLNYLANHGYQGKIVEFDDILHLKTGIAYIGDNTIIGTNLLLSKEEFSDFKQIKIDEDESYAANCIRVNDYVIVPEGFPKTKNAIKKAGFKTKSVDVSEYRKLDGGLSCLSLRF